MNLRPTKVIGDFEPGLAERGAFRRSPSLATNLSQAAAAKGCSSGCGIFYTRDPRRRWSCDRGRRNNIIGKNSIMTACATRKYSECLRCISEHRLA